MRNVQTGALVALAGVSVGVAVYCYKQMRKVFKLINKTADDIQDLTQVEVKEAIVDSAIEKAVDREVRRVANDAVQSVAEDIRSQTRKRVKDEVNTQYSKLSQTVSDNIAKEAAKIDSSRVMDDAIEKAKDILVQRFDGKLDFLVSKFQENLDNVGKIYQSVASHMTGKNESKRVSFSLD